MDPTSIPDVKEWTETVGGGTDYLDYLSQSGHMGLGAWAAFARVFMPRFVAVEGCVLWDRVYEPGNFRAWHKQLRGDATAIEATLNQFRLWDYVHIPDDPASEAGALALAQQIADSWHRCLSLTFPARAFDVKAWESEDGPTVSFVTLR